MEKVISNQPNLLLKSAREQRFWTQEEVAKLVGTSTVNVSRWERGITLPSPYFRNKLCEIFGKSSQELGLGEEDTIASSMSADNRVGEVFAEYHLNYLLAHGESADVYFAEDLRHKNEVVIKLPSTRLTGQDAQDFLNEASAVARLHHPHILRVCDFGVEDDIPYLVMDHAPKGSLRYPKGAPVPLETVVSYVKQTAEALQYAHGKGVLHRNIKPENLLVSEQDEVLLTDFAITRVIQGPRLSGGDVSGTLAYMAPELLQGHPSPASDQYALGMVVYEWLAGDLPTLHGGLTKIAGQTVLVLGPSTPQPGKLTMVSPEVEEVVLTALAQDPEKRFSSVQAFANALEQAFQSQMKDPAFASSIAPVPPPGHRPSDQYLHAQAPINRPPTIRWQSSPPPSSPLPTASASSPSARQRWGSRPSTRTSIGLPPVGRSQSKLLSRWRSRPRLLLYLVILLLLLFGVIASLLFALSRKTSAPTPSSWQSIIIAHDGESIGISDGTFAFDTNRLDGNLKRQAANRFKAGDRADAELLWQQAITNDTNDAEALIYLEDQRVLASGRPYFTLVAGTVLTGAFTSTGRDSLQGAYVAQKEYNDQCFQLPSCTPVRLLVANAGSGDSSNSGTAYASLIMEQIASAVRADKTIVGMMGWPLSSSSLYADTILASAGIPIVSPTEVIAPSTHTPPYFFSVAPSIDLQGNVGAQYAERTLHAKRVALFVDPVDRYSESLADTFSRHFMADGNTIVVTEDYTIGEPDTISQRVPDALGYHPDLIYFAGHNNDVGALLSNLPTSGPLATLQVLGGDALYELGGPSSIPVLNRDRLHFTAFAYPDEWVDLAPSAQAQEPRLFSEYPQDFDPDHQRTAGTYGYDRADSGVILSYDAMRTLLSASIAAFNGGQQSITPGDVQQALTQITGLQALQGASGRISFGPDGTPTNKVVVVLYWSPDLKIHLDQAFGCFLKPLPTTSPSPGCS